MNNITLDGDIDETELRQFRAWSFRLSLIAGSLAMTSINLFIMQTIVGKHFLWENVEPENRIAWQKWYEETYPGMPIEMDEENNFNYETIGNLVTSLGYDLGEDTASDDEELGSSGRLVDDMIQYL